MQNRDLDKATLCIHAGTRVDPHTRGVNTPVYSSTSYKYVDMEPPYPYPRYLNTANQQAVSEKLAALEHAEAGLVLSSGMAAVSHVMFALLQKGDHVVLQNDIYGGSHHFATSQLERFGIAYTFIHEYTEEAFEAAFRPETKMLWLETPTNPLLKIIDIETAARVAKRHGAISVIDNTFASPYNQNPIDFGVDVVMHSGTKYIGGHSDLTCGALLGSQELIDRIWLASTNYGGSLEPSVCSLVERSLKTLHVRMERHNENAQQVAEFLDAHEGVAKVNYPGLPEHPGHELAKRQMRGFGAMLSFELDESVSEANDFLRKLQIVTPGISLGGVETLASLPRDTSHSKMTAEERAEAGISDRLIRLSVGIESAKDLIGDLRQAIEACVSVTA